MNICRVTVEKLNSGKECTAIQFVGEGDLLEEGKKRVRKRWNYSGDGDAMVFRTVDDRSFALVFEGSCYPKSVITIASYEIEVFQPNS